MIELRMPLPDSGQVAQAAVDRDAIAVRVGDRVCVAHHRWMNADEARQLVATLAAVTA